MKKSYSQKLLDPRWQRKRLEVLSRDGFKCVKCKNGKRTLHVHHLSYKGNPWEVAMSQLETLCSLCHKNEHKKPVKKKVKQSYPYKPFIKKPNPTLRYIPAIMVLFYNENSRFGVIDPELRTACWHYRLAKQSESENLTEATKEFHEMCYKHRVVIQYNDVKFGMDLSNPEL